MALIENKVINGVPAQDTYIRQGLQVSSMPRST
jgi:hypothetical protein